mmetsp:Transcript_27541/g.69428  ORF Transcript_27541/g.69428 Transcript_27541/m.69428 type:complete len:213 (-) Transcript_27541:581-1219(-)
MAEKLADRLRPRLDQEMAGSAHRQPRLRHLVGNRKPDAAPVQCGTACAGTAVCPPGSRCKPVRLDVKRQQVRGLIGDGDFERLPLADTRSAHVEVGEGKRLPRGPVARPSEPLEVLNASTERVLGTGTETVRIILEHGFYSLFRHAVLREYLRLLPQVFVGVDLPVVGSPPHVQQVRLHFLHVLHLQNVRHEPLQSRSPPQPWAPHAQLVLG